MALGRGLVLGPAEGLNGVLELALVGDRERTVGHRGAGGVGLFDRVDDRVCGISRLGQRGDAYGGLKTREGAFGRRRFGLGKLGGLGFLHATDSLGLGDVLVVGAAAGPDVLGLDPFAGRLFRRHGFAAGGLVGLGGRLYRGSGGIGLGGRLLAREDFAERFGFGRGDRLGHELELGGVGELFPVGGRAAGGLGELFGAVAERGDRGRGNDGGELAQLGRAIGLDHLEGGVRQARQIHEGNLDRVGGVALEAGFLVLPLLDVGAALAEPGVDALLDLVPLGVVDDLGANLDLLVVVVEVDFGHLAGGNGAVHRAKVAEALAVGRLGDLARPLLVIGLGRGVVADFLGPVGGLGGGNAVDQALSSVDLGNGDEHAQRVHLRLLLGKFLGHAGRPVFVDFFEALGPKADGAGVGRHAGEIGFAGLVGERHVGAVLGPAPRGASIAEARPAARQGVVFEGKDDDRAVAEGLDVAVAGRGDDFEGVGGEPAPVEGLFRVGDRDVHVVGQERGREPLLLRPGDDVGGVEHRPVDVERLGVGHVLAPMVSALRCPYEAAPVR